MTKENFKKSIFDEEEEVSKLKLKELRKHCINRISKCLEYAVRAYDCEFPKGFAEKLYDISYEKKMPSPKVVDAIVAEWKIWEPYVYGQSFNKFMQLELERIFKNQVATTFSSKKLKGYIGNKAIVLKEPPKGLITTIFASGKLIKNGTEEPIF